MINIGIDVGWSACSRSCAVAVHGINPGWGNDHATTYADNTVFIKLFRLDELVAWLPQLIELIRDRLPQTTVVIDGPLGRYGPPQLNRYVDRACRRNGFYGRAFPNDVTGANGRRYVDTTYEIVGPFLGAQQGCVWLGQCERNGLVVAETHPTVGLAMLIQKLNFPLPSRRRPMAANGRHIRAKSDWYWLHGGGAAVANILGNHEISNDTHHERRAALFCLASAVTLSQNNAITIGQINIDVDTDRTGAYLLPAQIHQDWMDDIGEVGIISGEPAPVNPNLIDVPHEPIEDPDDGEPLYGQQILCICDFGGIWQTHNPWLEDCETVMQAHALDGAREHIRIQRAGGHGQWTTVDGAPSIRQLASARGFMRDHLSLESRIDIPIEIRGCE